MFLFGFDAAGNIHPCVKIEVASFYDFDFIAQLSKCTVRLFPGSIADLADLRK
jgi:hypothetical protein